MMYSEKVLDHFSNPRNVGEIEDADGVGEIGNAKCGDIMKMYLKIDKGIITDAKFKTFGCGAAVATSSMATELIKGKSIDDALKLTNQAVVEALDGLPAVKIHCSVLAEQAVRSALSDYYTRQGIDPLPIVGEIKELQFVKWEEPDLPISYDNYFFSFLESLTSSAASSISSITSSRSSSSASSSSSPSAAAFFLFVLISAIMNAIAK